MEVETRLADADALRMSGQFHQAVGGNVGFLGRLMGVRAHREEHLGVVLGDGSDGVVTRHARGDRDQARNPRGLGTGHDGVPLGLEVREIQMAVAIDQHQADAGST